MKTDQLFNFPNNIRWIKLLEKKYLIILFLYLIFILFLILQHSMVFLYNDDWGYSVLEYGVEQTGFSGQNFTLSHALGFLVDLYEAWSGRVFSIFLEIYLIKFGLWYVRLFQVLAILCVLYYSMRIAIGRDERNKRIFLVFILPILLYLSLDPHMYMGGIYWFAAAAGYLWGIPVFLLAAHSILINRKITFGSSLMLSLSAIFHEEMGFVAITFILSYIIYDHFLGSKKQHILEKIYLSTPIALLAAATIFAPGNFARKSLSDYGSKSMYEIILMNMTSMSGMFFSLSSIFFWILFLSFVIFSFSSSKGPLRSVSDFFACCFPAIALLASYLLLSQLLFAIFFVGLFSFVLLRSCRLSEAGIVVFSVFVASLGSLVPLLLAPVVAWRAAIPFYLLLFVPILFSIMAIKDNNFKYFIMTAFGVIFIFSGINSANIFNGYRKNYEVNIINHYQLMIANHKLRNNIEIENKIILFRLPSPWHAEMMPYQRPLIEKWMKKYYELPQDVSFDWR